MSKKILITGFQPFLSEKIIHSELLLDKIKQSSTPVDTLILPVSYNRSYTEFIKYYQEDGHYEVVLMLGQAGGRKAICLERIAINWYETSHPDEDGFCPPVGRINPGGPDAYISDFFPTKWKTQLSQFAPVEVSHSAGVFVCNSLYYQAQAKLKNDSAILFAHLPYLPEQVLEKPTTTPSMELEIQLKVVLSLIDLIHKI